MTYVIYKNPWGGGPWAGGSEKPLYEVRLGEITVEYCQTREEAKRAAHALNTKPASTSVAECLIALKGISRQ